MTVFQLAGYDLRVTFDCRDQGAPFVELTVCSELRTFPVPEFSHFWLERIELSRQTACAYWESRGELPSANRPRPRASHKERTPEG